MARLFGDENFPLPTVIELRHLGHDVVTLYETGNAGRSMTDDAVLALASADDRAVLTSNRRHFIRLHTMQPGHAGIIVCSFDPDFRAQAARIDAAIRNHDRVAGVLLRIERSVG